jgi:hypothetical protein
MWQALFHELCTAFYGAALTYAFCWFLNRRELLDLRERLDMANAAVNEQQALAHFDCEDCGCQTLWSDLVHPVHRNVCDPCVDKTRCQRCGTFEHHPEDDCLNA